MAPAGHPLLHRTHRRRSPLGACEPRPPLLPACPAAPATQDAKPYALTDRVLACVYGAALSRLQGQWAAVQQCRRQRLFHPPRFIRLRGEQHTPLAAARLFSTWLLGAA